MDARLALEELTQERNWKQSFNAVLSGKCSFPHAILELPNHKRLNGVAFTRDGRFLGIVNHDENGVQSLELIWDVNTETALTEPHDDLKSAALAGFNQRAVYEDFSPGAFIKATASEAGVTLYRNATGTFLDYLPFHNEDAERSVAFSPDGTLVAFGCKPLFKSGVIVIWKCFTERPVAAFVASLRHDAIVCEEEVGTLARRARLRAMVELQRTADD